MSKPTDPRITQAKAKDFGGPVVKVIFALRDDDPNGACSEQVAKAQVEEIWVPLNLLQSSSHFLQAAIKLEWDALRDDKHSVTLDSDPMFFKAYVHWLYRDTDPRSDDALPDEFDYEFLATLYV